ncbi:RDD family protein [Microbacterium ulmi]|uniref:RDD family protein n=1 Tax=Microbacterium ulmi TaxID=179095 RepID=A0A7Y2LZ18_9MICO|nr:RDD family protein [Microbacterium ulmi]NII70386.1 putative RDD family membrane protein YckC [Microbacterium ulmi]NNH03434.1 RDD family protein [Microbacterium ulmi]
MAAAPAVVEIRQDEVLTGEAVALDVQPLGFFLRALGAFIDVVVGIALFLLFLLVAGFLTAQGVVDAGLQQAMTIVVVVLVTIVVPTVVETATRGRSLGKLAVGGRVVRTDGGSSGFRQAFIRAVVGVLEIWLTAGAVAAVVGAFTRRSQRLGDLLAGTYAERTRTPKLPAPASGIPPVLLPWSTVADVARLPDRLARRTAQFAQNAEKMAPAARARVAASLAADVATHVSPVPAVDAETFLRAVVAVRRDRELRALVLESQRVAALTAGATGAPRGFPDR